MYVNHQTHFHLKLIKQIIKDPQTMHALNLRTLFWVQKHWWMLSYQWANTSYVCFLAARLANWKLSCFLSNTGFDLSVQIDTLANCSITLCLCAAFVILSKCADAAEKQSMRGDCKPFSGTVFQVCFMYITVDLFDLFLVQSVSTTMFC